MFETNNNIFKINKKFKRVYNNTKTKFKKIETTFPFISSALLHKAATKPFD